jgi:hypothetical protein
MFPDGDQRLHLQDVRALRATALFCVVLWCAVVCCGVVCCIITVLHSDLL